MRCTEGYITYASVRKHTLSALFLFHSVVTSRNKNENHLFSMHPQARRKAKNEISAIMIALISVERAELKTVLTLKAATLPRTSDLSESLQPPQDAAGVQTSTPRSNIGHE